MGSSGFTTERVVAPGSEELTDMVTLVTEKASDNFGHESSGCSQDRAVPVVFLQKW
jgi:hypothetical protein